MSGKRGGGKELCAACAKAATCTLPATWSGPVRRCDQFEPKTGKESIKGAQSLRVPEDARAPKGLCVTCENMPECPFPWPEEGIWHCEHYR